MRLIVGSLAATALLSVVTAVCAKSGPLPGGTIEPNAEVRTHLDGLVSAPRNSAAMHGHVASLREMLQPHRPDRLEGYDLVRQAILFAAERPGVNDKALKVLRWQFELRESTLLTIALPYHDSEDKRLRTFVAKLIKAGDTPVFELDERDDLVGVLLNHVHYGQKDPPWGWVLDLYRKAPSAALRNFAGSWTEEDETRRDLIWAEHLVSTAVWRERHRRLQPGDLDKAVAELEKLAGYKEWWVQLYVAEMQRRHEFLRRPAIAARLEAGGNEMVVAALNEPFYGGVSKGEREERRRALGKVPKGGVADQEGDAD